MYLKVVRGILNLSLMTGAQLLFVTGQISYAASGITYQGRLMSPTGAPVTSSSVQFKIQIRTPGTEDCLLYEEIQTLDLSSTKGTFALSLGDGSGTRQDSNSWNLFDSLSNRKAFTFSAADCTAGTSYTPGATDNRKFRVHFNDGSFAGWESLPVQTINFIPMSIESYAVGGFPASSLLRVQDGGTLGTPSALSTAQYNEILALVGGTSSLYTKAGQLGGSNLPALTSGQTVVSDGSGGWSAATPLTSESDPNVSAFAKASLPTCGAGEVLKADGTSLSCVTDTSGGTPADATDSTKGIASFPVAGGLSVSSGAVSIPDQGSVTPGAYPKVTVNQKGIVTAHSSLSEGDIPTLSTAGKVSGDAITSGTIAGSTAVNTSGNITTSGNVTATGSLSSASLSTRQIDLYDSDNTNKITLVTPATGDLTSDYSLMFPTSLGSANQVLGMNAAGTALENKSITAGSNVTITHSAGGIQISASGGGSGLSSLNGETGGTQTFAVPGTSGTAPGWSSSSNTHTLNIPMASAAGVTAGLLSKTDYDSFSGKLSAVSGSSLADTNIWVGNGSGQAAAVAVSGDATLSNTGALSVTKIRGTSVNSSAPTLSGQVLKYDGTTEYAAGFINVADIRSSVTPGNATFPLTCTAAQTLVHSAVTDQFSCTNIAIASTAVSGLGTAAAQDVGTGSGNIPQLDGSGKIPTSMLPSGSGDILDGGNTTGSTVVIGTNDAQSLQLETNNSPAMTILSGGNVGIGTATPGSPLHVRTNVNGGGQIHLENDSAGTFASSRVRIENDSNRQLDLYVTGSGNTNEGADLAIVQSSTSQGLALKAQFAGTPVKIYAGGSGASDEKMRILSSGYVGIGTTVPASALDVNGALTTRGMSVPATSPAGQGRIYFDSTANKFKVSENNGAYVDLVGSGGGSGDIVNGGNTTGSTVVIGTNDAQSLQLETNNSPAMTILSGGNVGIGTATPGRLLHVEGPIRVAASALPGTPAAGDIAIDSGDGNKLKYYNGSGWQTLGVAGSGLSSLNGETGGTQSFGAPGTSGTAPAWSSSSNVHTLNIPMASAAGVTAGLLSKTDYDSFSGKLSAVSGSSLADTNIWVGNGSGQAAAVAMSGDATLANDGTLTLATSGATAGTYKSVTVDAKGRVTAGTNPTTLSGYGITDAVQNLGGVATMAAGADASKPLAGNSGAVYLATDTQKIYRDNGATWDEIANVDTGSAGLTSLNGETGGTQTFAVPGTSGTAPAWSSSSNTHTLNIPMASAAGVTAGLLSKTDYDSFSGKLSAVAGSSLADTNIWVGNGSNQAAAVAVSGDVSLANTGAMTVTQIQGTAVDNSAPTLSGQVLKYDGTTEYAAGFINVADIRSSVTPGNATFPLTCTAAQTLVHSAVTDQFSCTNIAIASTAVSGLGTAAAQDVGTGSGDIPQLDGSGKIPSSMLPTGTGDILDGGNTTGSTVVIGTNDAQSLQLETNNSPAMTILSGGNVGIGTATPGAMLEVAKTTSPHIRIKEINSAPAAISRTMAGLELSMGEPATNYFGPAIKFMSHDSDLTTENPKFLAGIVPRATESYTTDNGGGMAIDFVTTPNAPGASSLPSTRMTINSTGYVGIGTTVPGSILDINGALTTRGMSVPATSPAGQGRIYFDSTANKFKVSENNGAYVDLVSSGGGGDFMKDGSVTMTGQFKADDGTLAAPGISFGADTDTGIYRYASDGIRIVTGGSMVLQAATNAGIRLPGGKGNTRVNLGNTCTYLICVSYASSSPTVTPAITDEELVMGIARNTSNGAAGEGLYLTAGGADSGAVNAQGGSLVLASGISTGNQGSDILFMTATGGSSSSTDRTPTEKMRIKGSGYVGIGTSAPGSALDVNGALTTRGMSVPATSPAGQGRIYFDSTANKFKVSENNGAYVDLVGSGGGSGDFLADGTVDMTDTLVLAAGALGTGGVSFVGDSDTGMYRATTNEIAFDTGGTERLRLDFEGELGIGTSTPITALHVHRPSGQWSEMYFTNGDTGATSGDGLALGIVPTTNVAFISNAENTAMTFATNNTERMRISNSGYVGIGTDNPGTELHVLGKVKIEEDAGSSTGSANPLTITAHNGGGAGADGLTSLLGFNVETETNGTFARVGDVFVAATDATAGTVDGRMTLRVYKDSAAVDAVVIQSSGNVGIGTTNPLSTLEVDGAIRNTASISNGTSTVDFATGNLQYTTSNCGAFNLHNLKDGGTYSFAVQGTSSTTCSFNAYSDAGSTALTVHLPAGHGATTAGEHTMYTIMVMGTHAYFAWITEFD